MKGHSDMNLKNEKIFGYILLVVGIVLLFFSVAQMIIVYGGGSPPPKLVSFSDISLPSQNGTNVTAVAGDQLSQLPNLFFWFILMFFVMFAGGKVASLGVNMIKDIKVEVKQPLRAPSEAGKASAEE
jgi:hypothetical protein